MPDPSELTSFKLLSSGSRPSGTTAAQPEPPADRLQQITRQLQTKLSEASQGLVEAGELLLKAKDILPHGKFQAWLREHFSMSGKTANRLMSIATMVIKLNLPASLVSELVRLDFNTLCEIAAKSTPQEVQNRVLAKIADGQPINYNLVRNIKYHPDQTDQDLASQELNKKEFLQFMRVLRQFCQWYDLHCDEFQVPRSPHRTELALRLESYALKLREASDLVNSLLEQSSPERDEVIHIKPVSYDDERPL